MLIFSKDNRKISIQKCEICQIKTVKLDNFANSSNIEKLSFHLIEVSLPENQYYLDRSNGAADTVQRPRPTNLVFFRMRRHFYSLKIMPYVKHG